MPGTLLLRAGDEKKLELGAGRPDLEAAQRRDDSRSTHVDAPVGNHADAGSIPAASTINLLFLLIILWSDLGVGQARDKSTLLYVDF